MVLNIGDEARRAVPGRMNEIAYLRVAAVVTDYIASDYIRHFLTGIVISGTPECMNCRANLRIHSLDVKISTE